MKDPDCSLDLLEPYPARHILHRLRAIAIKGLNSAGPEDGIPVLEALEEIIFEIETWHANIPMKIRPLRGQVVIRETKATTGPLWTPDPNPREVHTHTGRVLAMGPPARTPTGAEVAPGFQPGDLVQYHFTHNQENATNTWEDGALAHWIPQENVDGVWE